MKAKTHLKDVKVLVDDGRLIDMIVDGDLTRVESVIRTLSKLTHRVLNIYSVYDRNTKKMVIDRSRIVAAFVRVKRT